MRQSTWWYVGSLLETVATVFFFAVYASSDDGNTLGLAVVWVVFAVLFFYLGRRDAG